MIFMNKYENELYNKGYINIAGIDEAGRGPVAGPVVAAAVILKKDFDYEYINDSKKMTEKQRKIAYKNIVDNAIVGIGIVDHKMIDKVNILEATKLAMLKALEELTNKPDYVLIDAVKLEIKNSLSIIKGDQKSISIAAASIIAKVTRDMLMIEYDKVYPAYMFKNHKGYLTKAHQEKIIENGPCEIHRKSFAPISSYYK